MLSKCELVRLLELGIQTQDAVGVVPASLSGLGHSTHVSGTRLQPLPTPPRARAVGWQVLGKGWVEVGGGCLPRGLSSGVLSLSWSPLGQTPLQLLAAASGGRCVPPFDAWADPLFFWVVTGVGSLVCSVTPSFSTVCLGPGAPRLQGRWASARALHGLSGYAPGPASISGRADRTWVQEGQGWGP